MFDFSAIKGNDGLVRHMKNALRSGRISHAYIFEGQQGMGKKLAAKTFAKGLQCESWQDRPCNSCVSCRAFESNNHPDVIYVLPTKTKSIGVDDIREQVSRNMDIKPYLYQYKIFIIDHADTMTPAAQNALLKTIEEPASFGIFLLMSANRHHFLPTILSRCVMLTLKPLPDSSIAEMLIDNGFSLQDAEQVCVYARGNLGRAMQLADNEDFRMMRSRILKMLQNLRAMDMAGVFTLFSLFEEYKDNIQELLDIVYMWYRDCFAAKTTGSDRFLMQKDIKNEIMEAAASTGAKALYNRLEAVWKTKRRLMQNGNFQLNLEVMILHLSGMYDKDCDNKEIIHDRDSRRKV